MGGQVGRWTRQPAAVNTGHTAGEEQGCSTNPGVYGQCLRNRSSFYARVVGLPEWGRGLRGKEDLREKSRPGSSDQAPGAKSLLALWDPTPSQCSGRHPVAARETAGGKSWRGRKSQRRRCWPVLGRREGGSRSLPSVLPSSVEDSLLIKLPRPLPHPAGVLSLRDPGQAILPSTPGVPMR